MIFEHIMILNKYKKLAQKKSVHLKISHRSLFPPELKNWAIICFRWNSFWLSLVEIAVSHLSLRWEKEAFRQHLHLSGSALYCAAKVVHQSINIQHPYHENFSRLPFTCDFCQLKYSPFGHKTNSLAHSQNIIEKRRHHFIPRACLFPHSIAIHLFSVQIKVKRPTIEHERTQKRVLRIACKCSRWCLPLAALLLIVPIHLHFCVLRAPHRVHNSPLRIWFLRTHAEMLLLIIN